MILVFILLLYGLATFIVYLLLLGPLGILFGNLTNQNWIANSPELVHLQSFHKWKQDANMWSFLALKSDHEPRIVYIAM